MGHAGKPAAEVVVELAGIYLAHEVDNVLLEGVDVGEAGVDAVFHGAFDAMARVEHGLRAHVVAEHREH